jgi:F1F0 ATPase subunit 2
MNIMTLLSAFLAGIGTGVFFFGGLWLTVRKAAESHHPGRLSLGSFFIRAAISLPVIHFATGGQWQRLVACLAGFFLMRVLFTHFLRPDANLLQPSEKRV